MAPALSEYDHLKDYRTADKALGDKNRKTIGNNTELVRGGDAIYVELHGHSIIKYNRDDTLNLYSRGYETSTTKDRLNRYTPSNVSIRQKDFEWIVEKGEKTRKFSEGMAIRT